MGPMADTIDIYYPEESLRSKYDAGEFAEIHGQICQFIQRRKFEIRELISDSDRATSHPAVSAMCRMVERTKSINLPFEMGRQIQEINKEVWIQCEKGHGEIQGIKESWAQRYAILWRKAYAVELFYVIDRHRDELEQMIQAD